MTCQIFKDQKKELLRWDGEEDKIRGQELYKERVAKEEGHSSEIRGRVKT